LIKKRILWAVALVILLLIVPFAFVYKNNQKVFLFGYRYYTIKSGSMDPSIKINSIVTIKKASSVSINEGDIIAYISEELSNKVVVHRVTKIEDDSYITQGDNVSKGNTEKVKKDNVIGKCVNINNKISTFISRVSTLQGLIIFIAIIGIIVTSTVLILNLIKKEWRKT
jgi:signal peptidase